MTQFFAAPEQPVDDLAFYIALGYCEGHRVEALGFGTDQDTLQERAEARYRERYGQDGAVRVFPLRGANRGRRLLDWLLENNCPDPKAAVGEVIATLVQMIDEIQAEGADQDDD